jgi:hypothetical protein
MINNPAAKAYYCAGGVSVVGRLVENAVHMRLPGFAQVSLFGPLGISRADWVWNYDRLDEKTVLTRLSTPDARQEDILKALQVPLPGQSL